MRREEQAREEAEAHHAELSRMRQDLRLARRQLEEVQSFQLSPDGQALAYAGECRRLQGMIEEAWRLAHLEAPGKGQDVPMSIEAKLLLLARRAAKHTRVTEEGP